MKSKFILLIDFSPHSLSQVKLAEKWSEWINAELLLVHHPDVVYPSLSDQLIRHEITVAEKEQALDKLRAFAINNIKKTIPVQYHVSEENLLLYIKEIVKKSENCLIFVGLKNTGFFKRIYPGSTVTRVVDEINTTVVAVPKDSTVTSSLTLYIGINHIYPLNEREFDKLLQMLGDKVVKLTFLSVVTEQEEKERSTAYLESLATKYNNQKLTSIELYKGKDAYKELKQYMFSHTDGLLVLQRGARSVTDQLFRTFMINELIYDACIPLIILPA